MHKIRSSWRKLFVGIGMVSAMLSLSILTAPAANAHGDLGGLLGLGGLSGLGGIGNGSFETPQVPANTFTTVYTGGSIGPWTVTQGNVDHIGRGFWQAADGVQSVDLGGSTNGAVAQTVDTVPGLTYTVKFAVAGNPDGPPTVKTGRALVNGQPALNFSFDITGKSRAAMGYQYKKFSFLSLGTHATVEFASTSGTAFGPVIDAVTVRPCLFVICL